MDGALNKGYVSKMKSLKVLKKLFGKKAIITFHNWHRLLTFVNNH